MKISLLIAGIICAVALSISATTYNVTNSVNVSSLGVVAGDFINVQTGGILTVDVNFTCSGIAISGTGWVRESANNLKMTVDGWTMTGGQWDMGTADSLITTLITVSGGTLAWAGTTNSPVVIQGKAGSTAKMVVSGTGTVVNLSHVTYLHVDGSSYPYGGLAFNTVTAANISLANCIFDTSGVSFLGTTYASIHNSTIKTYGATGRGIMFWNCGYDTVLNCRIINNAGGTNGLQAIDAYNSDHAYIYGSYIESYNEGTYTTSSCGIFLEGASHYAKIISDTVIGFSQPIVLGSPSGGITNVSLLNSYIHTGTQSHEAIIFYDGSNNLTIAGSKFWGRGARSLICSYCDATAVTGLKIYYNTSVGSDTLGVSSCPIAFEHTASGILVYNGVEVVGNIFCGTNPSYNKAGILLGTTSAQTVTVNFSQFKHNAFNGFYAYGSSSVTYPYTMADSNKSTCVAFGFVDSAKGDFRLVSGAPLLNCGETSIFTTYFGGTNPPGDIGYYQSNITGSCGTTPTGACCATDGTCSQTTAAACTSPNVYHGDGVSCGAVNCLGSPGPTPGPGPSPFCRQLHIGFTSYYGPWWNGYNFGGYDPGSRDWAADRACLIVGGHVLSDWNYMKTVNPNMKDLAYTLYARYSADTAYGIVTDTLQLKTWADSMYAATSNRIYRMDSMVLRTGATAADSVQTNFDGNGGQKIAGGGKLITFNSDAPYKHRYAFDIRDYVAVGQYLWYAWNHQIAGDNFDGFMPDEEGLGKVTGTTNAGIGTLQPLFRDSTDWVYGFNKFQHPWTAPTWPTVADSCEVLWALANKIIGDSVRAHNLIVAPNGAAYWGPHPLNPTNWTTEARHRINNYGGAYLGEGLGWWVGSYQYGHGTADNLIKRMIDLKDSALNIVVGYINCGGYDSLENSSGPWLPTGLTQPRWKINALGLMLACDYAGTTTYYFVPNQWNSNNDFKPVGQYILPASVYADSTALWSYTWTKYFGVKTSVRDTSVKGSNDGQGQSYLVWQVQLMNPTNTSDPLTFAAGRFPSGTNYDTVTTAVNVTMPGNSSKHWYRLRDNSGGFGAAGLASWETTPVNGGTTITIGNSQWKVYSSDTVLANSGVIDTTLTITGDSKIEGQTLGFHVHLNRPLSNISHFEFSAESYGGNTATQNVDYLQIHRQIIDLAPGQTDTTIAVTTYDDATVESNETLTGTIGNATVTGKSISIPSPTAIGTIIDNDVAGQPGTAQHIPHWRRK